MTKYKFVYAFDKQIDKRVPHVIKGNYIISLVTGNKQRYTNAGDDE